ncbi:DUF2309 domain-containing protein [Mangrovimicrobium sediminis]|uniref:Probable inorganic carbon transporter subunit DabA n=1 Tax=Mangrovimicrobium sediminis TaxID=2562682 RepID=A0A4Z0M3F7_9GAMM|nr:DUF2309 domain-containing protein [Haliea sp. SAOS-164]TGD73980.1 DUF2309 domain-containing protein [Haliea sp. SAOS-164]
MNAPATRAIIDTQSVLEAIDAACERIAPTWPLDRMIAVSPYWERIDQPFDQACNALEKIAGSSLTMPLAYYREQLERGHITKKDLKKAVRESRSSLTVRDLLGALHAAPPAPVHAPLLSSILDAERDLHHEPAWCDTITHQVAQFCAAYFDRDQADWHPGRERPLYASWRDSLTRDHSVSLLMKNPRIAARARTLQDTPEAQVEAALLQLGVAPQQWQQYLQSVIMRLSGWAAWCAYQRWQARLAGGDDHTLVDLLAIRLGWECLVDDGEREPGSVWHRWQRAWNDHFHDTGENNLQVRLLWQRAQEISYQDRLFQQLGNAVTAPATASTQVQAVFCIDVRSEVIRRHLEAQSGGIQTLGFAGFFGLPIAYAPLGTQASRPQLPGLLAPALHISESSGDPGIDQQVVKARQAHLQRQAGWRPFRSLPASAFTLVETLGLGYAAKLIKDSLPGTAGRTASDTPQLGAADTGRLRPSLKTALGDNVAEQAEMASRVLDNMGLSGNLAPLVLLVGHGSQTRNNPQRAGLDCGACCGQAGDINARALADLLNDSAVRAELAGNGRSIPDTTWFVAGLHNTTTDDIELFDTGLAPACHTEALAQLRQQLRAAGCAARRERAPSLGLQQLADHPSKLEKAVRRLANDWAQTRPEWGLANNAAFIVAPRSRTRDVDLGGRSFLHDYDPRRDPDGRLLEQIMTAPMIVTHWINMQYYASTVDNRRYGSGNKILHNVVGGRIGVFEGNGGDLRIGLARQSVHDGSDWRHEPLRLTVVIEAPRHLIEQVIDSHEMVRNLLDHQWLHLARIDDQGIECYRQGLWQTWTW